MEGDLDGSTERGRSVVSKEAEDAISFLRERRDFWGQFKPMYVTKK